jgi:folate-dependent phosphoribosylglycinamide formyltransferase PurN
MSQERLRVIILTHGAGELAIRRLLDLDSVEIAGIFVETETSVRRSLSARVRRSILYDGYSLTVWKLARRLLGLDSEASSESAALADCCDRLRTLAVERGIPIHFVANYHANASIELMRQSDPDLGVVLGTNILKESVFKIPRLGSINLHQGLAPYYRGCPAIFWELFNGEREIGLTIHFVESKVDTGEIILQRTVPLEYDYSHSLNYEAFIADYRHKLIVPCANLVAEAVRMLADGPVNSMPQDTALGKRYRLPLKREKDELRRRLLERRREPAAYRAAEKASGGD